RSRTGVSNRWSGKYGTTSIPSMIKHFNIQRIAALSRRRFFVLLLVARLSGQEIKDDSRNQKHNTINIGILVVFTCVGQFLPASLTADLLPLFNFFLDLHDFLFAHI